MPLKIYGQYLDASSHVFLGTVVYHSLKQKHAIYNSDCSLPNMEIQMALVMRSHRLVL